MYLTVYSCIFSNLSVFNKNCDPILFFFWSNHVPQMSRYLGPWVYNQLVSLTTYQSMCKGKDQITIPVTFEFTTGFNGTWLKCPSTKKHVQLFLTLSSQLRVLSFPPVEKWLKAILDFNSWVIMIWRITVNKFTLWVNSAPPISFSYLNHSSVISDFTGGHMDQSIM